MADTQPVETTVEQTGTLKFGLQGLNNPTPKWAVYVFRGFYILGKVILFWLASTHKINKDDIQEVLLDVSAVDLGVWIAARFVGLKKSDFEN